jgi:hypothetical protein
MVTGDTWDHRTAACASIFKSGLSMRIAGQIAPTPMPNTVTLVRLRPSLLAQQPWRVTHVGVHRNMRVASRQGISIYMLKLATISGGARPAASSRFTLGPSAFAACSNIDTRKPAATRAARHALAWLDASISPLGIMII